MANDAHRVGDNNTAPASITTSAQSSVFINNQLASVDNSTVVGHGTGAHAAPLTANGSSSVLSENIPMNFQGNADTCGHIRDAGSPNVFIHSTATAAIIGYPDSLDTTDELNLILPEIQPGVTEQQAAIHLHDDETDDNGVGTFPQKPITTISILESKGNGVNPDIPEAPSIEEEPDTPPPLSNILDNCTDIFAHIGAFPGSFILSTNYNLADLTTNTILSNYPLQTQAGLSEADIVCNLRHVAINILEPIRALYPAMFITSGFRHGAGTSQHHKGEAVDIQFSQPFSLQQYWDAVRVIRDTIKYDQLILEYGRNPWFHLSFNLVSNRQDVLTRTKPGLYRFGLIRLV